MGNEAMNQADRTIATNRVLITVATAALWLANAGGGFAAEPPTGPTYTNSLGMAFVRFEPGTFTMGVGTDLRIADIKNGPDYDEQPAHPVTLTAPFYVPLSGSDPEIPTRRKYEDETFPPEIPAFMDACSGNRAHPGGSEHV